MIPSLELLVNPKNLDSCLADFIMRLDCDQRRQMLWQFADQKKNELLEQGLAISPLVCFAVNSLGNTRGLAWLSPFEYGAATCACHFAFAGPTTAEQRLDVGNAFIRRAMREVDLLLALLPIPWRGARNFARSLGFDPILRMPRICWIEARQRHVDGMLMVRKKELRK